MALAVVHPARAQDAPAADAQRLQREQILEWQRQAQRPADLPASPPAADWLPPLPGEQPCVHLTAVQISVADGPAGKPLQAVPPALQAPAQGYLGTCVGIVSLQRLQANLQGRLQALGYISSRLHLPEQTMADGLLALQLRWGRVGQIHIQTASQWAGGAAPSRLTPSRNALALTPGDPLNLRDVEHTLENLARLPSQAAQFLIEPGAEPLVSDVRIILRPQAPWRMSLGADAAELRSGSPWDLQSQAWVDAPLGWSDQLMVSASGTPSAQGDQHSQRHSLYAQWSLPWGRHLLLWSASSARNSRSIAGGVGRFAERGDEDQASLRWQWTPWRGADWRTQVWAAWTERRSRSRIDDVELLSRRRVASELGLGMHHWRRLGCGEASAELEATQTRRLARVADFQDLQAPLPRQWRVLLEWQCVWPTATGADRSGSGSAPWTWAMRAWTQASDRPFDGTDLLTLGSRYTVRGHSTEQALQGQRISVLRASATAPGRPLAHGLAWQPWLAWDAGRLDRPAAQALQARDAPRHRQAAVLGLRWQAGAATGELTWARAIGPSPTPRHGQWQAQTSWWF